MEVDGGTEALSRGACTPSVKGRQTMNMEEEENISPSLRYTRAYMADHTSKRKRLDHRDPFAVRDYVQSFDSPKYGSVTKELEDLLARNKQLFTPIFRHFPTLAGADYDPMDLKHVNKFSFEDDNSKPDTNAQQKVVVIIDSDDDDEVTSQIPSKSYQDTLIKIPCKPNEDKMTENPFEGKDAPEQDPKKWDDTETAVKPRVKKQKRLDALYSNDDMDTEKKHADVAIEKKHDDVKSGKKQEKKHNKGLDALYSNDDVDNDKKHADVATEKKHDDVKSGKKQEKKHNKGEYVGVKDEDSESAVDFDGLGDIWQEMTSNLEPSKEIIQPCHETANEYCDHTFIFKEDIGSVCRVCGIIDRSIESIIEFQRPKASKSTRTYYYEGKTNKGERSIPVLNKFKLPGIDSSICEVTAHPRHQKQMKPHQIEGFNFLLSNLVCENPGGCILAHAPGSGKTFMLISFIQSFMAKFPDARPLVILPRGILGTWKKEFVRWQVEDLPLLDLYSTKSEGRTQQYPVLKKWNDERSILFLGYQQFSSIVCDDDTSAVSVDCQEILLKGPSIVILDEGHTPRNQDTNILTSLEKIETPLKVVLSGTLYQNHVREVFNILNLVRPRFLRTEDSKVIKRRILSRVPIDSKRNLLKKSTDNEFYDVVEHTLQKDENFKRKVAVIEDLREMTSKVLHYYKGDSLDELPGLVDFSVFLNLTPKQKSQVKELKKLTKKFKISSDGSALYVHPALKSVLKKTAKDKDDTVGKLEEVIENLDENEGVKAKFYLNLLQLCESGGERLLVFGQYLLPLKFLLKLTEKVKGWKLGKHMFMITGDNDNEERETAMEKFNNSPDSKVFFGSIKACGEGISLVGASRIIILDIHLNPSVTRQAIGRAFRPGQIRKVYTYRLIAADSPEAEDHEICFKKESISKMWFEWNEHCGHHDFEMEMTSVGECGDRFLENPWLNQDVTAVYKR